LTFTGPSTTVCW